MEKKFIKVRSSKDCIISFGVLIGGLALAFAPAGAAANYSGIIVAFVGALLLVVLKRAYKESSTGDIYYKTERFFPPNARQELCAKVASAPDSIDLSSEGEGSAVRLDIYSGNKSGKAYLQLFEYVPHSYMPCTAQYEYPIAKVSKIR